MAKAKPAKAAAKAEPKPAKKEAAKAPSKPAAPEKPSTLGTGGTKKRNSFLMRGKR